MTVGSLHLVTGAKCRECAGLNTIAVQQTGATECMDCSAQFNSFHAVVRPPAPIKVEAAPRHADPADHPYFQENPVHHDHIVDHWNKATDDEKEQGRNWYKDAHTIASALGDKYLKDHPHGSTHAAAGLIANYSPQMGWEGNLHNAARAMKEGKGLGGPGSGMFASKSQADVADKILGGAHNSEVIKSPKISDFGHLIEHGGDEHPENPKTVVDRHALSVASGKRVTDKQFSDFPKSNRHYYGHVVDQYNKAAAHISDSEVKAGREPVAAHQVQAATWLARQRLNQQGEKDSGMSGAKGREKGRQKQVDNWGKFREDENIGHAGPGTGYTKDANLNGGRPQEGARFPGGR